MMMGRLFSFAFYLIFGLTTCTPSTMQERALDEIIECGTVLNFDLPEGVSCGVLTVPENHEDPGGSSIAITYMVLKSNSQNPKSDPLIYFSGGPGSASLTRGTVHSWARHPVRETRDVILFDQRGIGHSSPLPDIEKELSRVMALNADLGLEIELVEEVLRKQKAIIEQQGIKLKHFNTFQNARDVGFLMNHLDYEQYCLYGGSYGTRLARVVQDLFPEKVKSVILNSPNPLGDDFLIGRLQNYSRALKRVFDYCKENTECNNLYPDLRKEYLRAIDQVKSNPIPVPLYPDTFFVNSQDAIYLIRRKLYHNNALHAVPELIRALAEENVAVIKDIIDYEIQFTGNFNSSMWLAVERYETFTEDIKSGDLDSIYQNLPLLPEKPAIFHSLYLNGKQWHNSFLSEDQKVHSQSVIPALIMVNYYDPVTPPENAYIMQALLPNSQVLILDEGGHGGGSYYCRASIMIKFLDKPFEPVDASCLKLYSK